MSSLAGSNVIIQICREFDVEAADKFRTELKNIMQKGVYNYTFDFNNCTFIDSTGLGVIVSVYKKCIENQGNIVLQHLNSDVLKVFKLTRLDKVFKIEE